MPSISVLIFTKNEENDLPACLESLKWSDDTHVLDCGSSDRTCEIASACGAAVVQRIYEDSSLPFGGDESAHRNWALNTIKFKHDWVYLCDADERVTPELVSAMHNAISDPKNFSAFRVRRVDYYLGRSLKYVTPSPFNIRLIKKNKVKFERAINPVPIIDGDVGEIQAHFEHFSFSKGFYHWISKHNNYSTLEAKQIIINRRENTKWSLWNAFSEPDKNKRRFHQKEFFYRLPCRPVIKFLLLYVIRRGFLDGYAGFSYAILQSVYEYMIVLKTKELERPQINIEKIK